MSRTKAPTLILTFCYLKLTLMVKSKSKQYEEKDQHSLFIIQLIPKHTI